MKVLVAVLGLLPGVTLVGAIAMAVKARPCVPTPILFPEACGGDTRAYGYLLLGLTLVLLAGLRKAVKKG